MFRGEQVNGVPYIYLGHSEDAIHWTFDKDKIPFVNEKGEPFMPVYAYDPRLVKVEDTYYIIWCQDFYGASIGIAKTTDFKTFVRIENPFIPFNRNAVLFPRKINGMYTLLSRPSDSGHTPFGDIFLSQSPDMEFWGRHRHVMSKGSNWWESVKIGGGAAPIETSEGWLLFYHGVTGTCNGFVYSIGGAILDRDEPSKVLSVLPSPPWTRWWITSRPTITQAPPTTRSASADTMEPVPVIRGGLVLVKQGGGFSHAKDQTGSRRNAAAQHHSLLERDAGRGKRRLLRLHGF